MRRHRCGTRGRGRMSGAPSKIRRWRKAGISGSGKSKSSEKLQKRHHTSTGCVRSLGMTQRTTQITLTYSQLWEIQKCMSKVHVDGIMGAITGKQPADEFRMGIIESVLKIVIPEVDRLLELVEDDLVVEETAVLADDEEIARFLEQ